MILIDFVATIPYLTHVLFIACIAILFVNLVTELPVKIKIISLVIAIAIGSLGAVGQHYKKDTSEIEANQYKALIEKRSNLSPHQKLVFDSTVKKLMVDDKIIGHEYKQIKANPILKERYKTLMKEQITDRDFK